MDVGVVGGGINGLCCAWHLSRQGHQVKLYERSELMQTTSCASSKLLHGGLRYLENGEFRLVREALRERDAWLQRAPHLTQALRPLISSAQDPKKATREYVLHRTGRLLTVLRGKWTTSMVLARKVGSTLD